MGQSLIKIYVHVVFSTKNRQPLLKDAWRDELFQVLGGTANQIGCQSLIVGGVADHVHMLFQLGKTITPADILRRCKHASSMWINETHRDHVPFHWQSGYGAFSVSQSNVDAVIEYIRGQPDHHKKESFQDELRKWFRCYKMEWDERYVWD